jgi:hypothetical protein
VGRFFEKRRKQCPSIIIVFHNKRETMTTLCPAFALDVSIASDPANGRRFRLKLYEFPM